MITYLVEVDVHTLQLQIGRAIVTAIRLRIGSLYNSICSWNDRIGE